MRSARALLAVMFTDLVDPTGHVVRIGDRAWRDTLDRHDTLVDRALERHRGRKVNTTGDGIVATFDGPSRAVRCAGAIWMDGMDVAETNSGSATAFSVDERHWTLNLRLRRLRLRYCPPVRCRHDIRSHRSISRGSNRTSRPHFR